MPSGVYNHKQHSEETKLKMSEAKKKNPVKYWTGKKHSKETKENMSANNGRYWNGKKLPEETRKKMGKGKKGRRSNNWKGGITPINKIIRTSVEYKLWRTAVFERDDYTCVWCGAKSGNGKSVTLNADHIKPFAYFPELRFAIDNGRTLCECCHRTTDTFGWKGYHKNYD